ncbi:MAG: hypothetical protein IPN16_24040 [Gemmatimonadetes bacterium]|nr:hypothetical protein [Gemmatimonadota bacterium]
MIHQHAETGEVSPCQGRRGTQSLERDEDDDGVVVGECDRSIARRQRPRLERVHIGGDDVKLGELGDAIDEVLLEAWVRVGVMEEQDPHGVKLRAGERHQRTPHFFPRT